MTVRGALALELVPGTQPGHAALDQRQAGALASLVGRDLASFAADAAALDLVFAGAHYDPAEVLRPGWPLHQRLEELHARAPRADAAHADMARVIAFGADDRGVVPLPLRAQPDLQGGALRVLPFLLVGSAERAGAVAAAFEDALLERGMAKADTALMAQEMFAAKIEHARYLTVHDLTAMMALQYRNVGLDALWPLLETALVAPDQDAWLDAPPEPLLRYVDGAVRMAEFDRSGWQRHYAADALDTSRVDRGFAHFQARQRQLAAILEVHGLDVEFVPCPAGREPRTALR